MITGETIALTRQTFADKVMSLFFNMLSRSVITFLPRSKRLLISWLQSSSAVILEPPKIKSVSISIVSPSICFEVMGTDVMILVFWMLSFKPTFMSNSLWPYGLLLSMLFCPCDFSGKDAGVGIFSHSIFLFAPTSPALKISIWDLLLTQFNLLCRET